MTTRHRWDDEPINCGLYLLAVVATAVFAAGYALGSVTT